MVVTRAADGGCGHGHVPIRTLPPLQPELFSLYEEPSGTRPEALAEPRPQERVQLRIVEQIVDFLPVVQILDGLVPQVGASSSSSRRRTCGSRPGPADVVAVGGRAADLPAAHGQVQNAGDLF